MENKELEVYIFNLMQFQSQVKIWHWQTKIYAKHKALCKLYDFISDQLDEFTETAMGKYGRPDSSGITHTFVNLNDKEIITTIDKYIEESIKLGEVLPKEDTDLLNLRDEVIGNLNKTKYLLTLK
jgi:DNA-binding ferritin-like protein